MRSPFRVPFLWASKHRRPQARLSPATTDKLKCRLGHALSEVARRGEIRFGERPNKTSVGKKRRGITLTLLAETVFRPLNTQRKAGTDFAPLYRGKVVLNEITAEMPDPAVTLGKNLLTSADVLVVDRINFPYSSESSGVR